MSEAGNSQQTQAAKPPELDKPFVGGKVTRVERNALGRLLAHVEGQSEPVEDVRVARCFPWSLPDQYVSIRNKDGKEIWLLKSLEELDEPSRQIVHEELRDKFFNPRIRRVVEFKHEFDVTSIKVETDRGPVTFQVRSRDDVRVLSPTRALFRDADGNTYELVDLSALDQASRKYLGDYL